MGGLEPPTYKHTLSLWPSELHDNVKARTTNHAGIISIIKYNLDTSHIFDTLNFCYALVLILIALPSMATFYICDTSQQASIVPKPCGAVSPSLTDGAAGTVTLASRIASRPAMYLFRSECGVSSSFCKLCSAPPMGRCFPVPFLSTYRDFIS